MQSLLSILHVHAEAYTVHMYAAVEITQLLDFNILSACMATSKNSPNNSNDPL